MLNYFFEIVGAAILFCFALGIYATLDSIFIRPRWPRLSITAPREPPVIERILRRLLGDKLWDVTGEIPTLGDDAVAFLRVKAPTKGRAKEAFRRHYGRWYLEDGPRRLWCDKVEDMSPEEIAEFDLETWNASQPPQTLGFDDPVMLPE